MHIVIYPEGNSVRAIEWKHTEMSAGHTICSRLTTDFILSLDKSVAVSHMQSASVRKKSPSISFGDSCPAVLYNVFICWLQHTCASARFLSVCVCFSSFFCCLTSRTSFPVIKAKGCLATSLVLIVRGDVSPLTGSPAWLSLTLCRECNVYGRCLLCVHDCSCISMEHCAFAPANIAQEDGKRERTEGVKVLTVFLYFWFYFSKKKKEQVSCVIACLETLPATRSCVTLLPVQIRLWLFCAAVIWTYWQNTVHHSTVRYCRVLYRRCQNGRR